MHRAARGQVFRNIAPLGIRYEEMDTAIDHLRTVAATALGGRYQRLEYAAIPRPSDRSGSAACHGCRAGGFRGPHAASLGALPHRESQQKFSRSSVSRRVGLQGPLLSPRSGYGLQQVVLSQS